MNIISVCIIKFIKRFSLENDATLSSNKSAPAERSPKTEIQK